MSARPPHLTAATLAAAHTAVRLAAILLALAGGFAMAAGAPDVLAIARKVAKNRYAGWTYGPSAAKKQVDCVQFVVAVVEEALGEPLSDETRRRLLISNIEPGEDLAALVEAADDRTRGVQYALVEAKKGVAVAPADIRPGDLLQYWYRSGKGWGGHCVVVESVNVRTDRRLVLEVYGSHKSTGGIATIEVDFSPSTGKKLYPVRLGG